jgi:hypothetical protein
MIQETTTMKALFSALAFATVTAFAAPSFAAEMMKCDDAGMMKVEQDAMAIKDKTHMEMAMKEVDMAKMAMKDGKMEDCAMHMDGAMKETMMK